MTSSLEGKRSIQLSYEDIKTELSYFINKAGKIHTEAKFYNLAAVVKLVYTYALGAYGAIRGGPSPLSGTFICYI